jgi:tagaturonate epimerase
LKAASANSDWSSLQFVSALRHDQKNPAYNPSFRQLLHVSFKVAAKKGDRYLNALKKHEAIVAKNVTENLFERHMKPLLLGF